MSVNRARITGTEIAEALQIVRDVATPNLAAPQRADADAAVVAIADAIAKDDPEALQDALADLELLGPTRLVTGDPGPAGLPAPAHVGLLITALEHGATRTDRTVWPVAIYLSDDGVHEQVETAVEALLTAAGLTVVERETPVLGSWFRRMRAAVSRATHSPVTREVMRSALHAADAQFLQRPDAEVTALLMQNLGPLITSLQPTKDAVVRVGAVLVVKVDWRIVVHQLTPGQRLLLDHNPDLESAPHSILATLRALDNEDAHISPAPTPLQPDPAPPWQTGPDM